MIRIPSSWKVQARDVSLSLANDAQTSILNRLPVTVHVESRAEADALYQALVAHELVLMAL